MDAAGGIEAEAAGDELIEQRLESGNPSVELGLHEEAGGASSATIVSRPLSIAQAITSLIGFPRAPGDAADRAALFAYWSE